jgi:flavodoxin
MVETGRKFMTIGIVYYSRTGNTRQAAKLLEEKLKERKINAKLIEIEAVKKPGYLKAGYAAFRQKELPIKNTELNLSEFDALLVGTPTWGGKPSPFIKTFFTKVNNVKGKKVGLFATGGSVPGSQTTTAQMMKEYAEQQGLVPVDAFLTLQMMSGEIKDGTQIIPHFLESVLSK